MSQQQTQEAPPIWPVDPSRAFTLLACRTFMPPDPRPEKKNEQEKNEDEEVDLKERLKWRLDNTPTKHRLAKSQENGNRVVSIGDGVQLALELASIVESMSNQQQQQDQSLPVEALELADRVKIGAVRWEACFGPSSSWIPAPPCAHYFPFRDTVFHPTADHFGLRMRALVVLHDTIFDRPIIFQDSNNNRHRPSVLVSDEFVIAAPEHARQIMKMAEERGQMAVFVREKIILPPLAVSENVTNDNNGEEDEGTTSNNNNKMQIPKQIELARSKEGRVFMVACRRRQQQQEEAAADEDCVDVRICTFLDDETEKQEEQQKSGARPTKIVLEGKWSSSSSAAESPSSLCSLSVRDDVTMTLHFVPTSSSTFVEVPVTFKTRLDRDVAALGFRSLM